MAAGAAALIASVAAAAALLLAGGASGAVGAGGPASPATPAGDGRWQLVWQDEFDGELIDTARWDLEENCWGGGNAEQQCYTRRKDGHPRSNAFLRDGLLHIVARKGAFTAPATPTGRGGPRATLPYTSARLRTRDRQDWTFGRFEIRARLPRGQGSWPAIWMLPTGSHYGSWAASGEIDILEAVNLGTPTDDPGAPAGTPETRVYGTLHFGGESPHNVHATGAYRLPDGASPADGFHVYALEWEEDEIRWYVDGVHYATQRAEHWFGGVDRHGRRKATPPGAPFDRSARFHLLLNLAVGGNWAGNVNGKGIDAAAYPQAMLVDYVRVYRCDAGRDDGSGCATRGPGAGLVVPQKSGAQFPIAD